MLLHKTMKQRLSSIWLMSLFLLGIPCCEAFTTTTKHVASKWPSRAAVSFTRRHDARLSAIPIPTRSSPYHAPTRHSTFLHVAPIVGQQQYQNSEQQKLDQASRMELVERLTKVSPTMSSCDYDTVAIVLNTNARGVTEHLVDAAVKIAQENGGSIPKVEVYVTNSLPDAQQAAKEIMLCTKQSEKQTLVVPVGGDGTLTTLMDQLWHEYNDNNNLKSETVNGATTNGDVPKKVNGMNGASTTPTKTNGDVVKLSNGDTQPNQSNNSKHFPISFAYIPMGTGNALGSVVACQAQLPKKRKRRLLKKLFMPVTAKNEHFQETLRQLLAGISNGAAHIQTTDVVELPLMQVQTFSGNDNNDNDNASSNNSNVHYTFFAGVGFDSLMLQDYKDMQEWSQRKVKTSRRAFQIYKFLKQNVFGGVTGYTVALFTKTLPQCVQRNAHLMHVRISTALPTETQWIDHRRGDLMRPVVIEKNDDDDNKISNIASTLLYQGQASIVAAGTAPFYGGGMRLFPFARMTPSGMHLRVGRIHPLKGVVNIPGIFAGSYRDNSDDEFGCLDFCGPQFVIDILTPHDGYPVQHSGESVGKCTRVQFAVAAAEQRRNGGNDDDDGSSALPLPPSMRFVTLLPPRLVIEEDE